MKILNDIWYVFNHTIITIILMLISCYIGIGLYMTFILSGYWFGREFNQAEMRYMKQHNITRSKLSFLDGFRLEAWNVDSFFIDLFLPVFTSILIYVTYILYFKSPTIVELINIFG